MKTISKAVVAAVIGITAALSLAAPSYASATPTAVAQPRAATGCVKTDDVCRVSTRTGGGFISFSTSFSGINASAPYEIRTSAGALLCSGSMGYNDTRSCTVNYSGTITFKFYKGQNAIGNISLQSS